MNQPTSLLTVAQTDEIILNAKTGDDSAIEDCQEFSDKVVYFFASGAVGEVRRDSGAVTITRNDAEGAGDRERFYPVAPNSKRASGK